MFNKIKKAFGFGNDVDDIINDDPEISSVNDSMSGSGSRSHLDATAEVNTEQTTTLLFEHVVAEFNKALPDFLGQSVDPERQKQFLMKAMSEDVRVHLAALEQSVSARIDESWRTEREKLKNDLKQVSDTAKDIETKRAELKQQQLSNERQRRALTERVHDLEKRILTIEAEKEQLELETKSLLNKVKVSQVHEKEAEELRDQIEHLQTELVRKQTSGESVDTPGETAEPLVTPEELERLRQVEKDYNKLNEHLGEIDQKMNQVEELMARKDERITHLDNEVAELTKQRDCAVENERTALQKLEKAIADAEKAHAEAVETVHKHTEPVRAVADAADDYQTPRNRKPVDLDADNDILNDTDWIVNPNNRSNKQKKNGNHRPKKTPRDDGQMSLW